MSDAISRHNEETLRRLRLKIAQDLVDKIRSVLIRMDIPINMDPERNIYNSISYTLNPATGEIFVGTDLPWGPVIEWGRLPGKAPPYEPIHQWVIRRLGKQDPEAKNIAWAVVNHIKNEGTKARRPFRISLEEWVRGV